MKTILTGGLALAIALVAAQAGPVGYQQSYTPPPTASAGGYGLGWYWGLQGGLNAYQSYEGTETVDVLGRAYEVEMKEKLGGFAGLKLGYGFDGGMVKPALELDGFYNGADYDLVISRAGRDLATATGRFDTFAFLLNGLFRFDLGSAWMPYAGVGIGAWVGTTSDGGIDINGNGTAYVGSDETTFSLAAQGLLGFDYYFSDRISFFTEYKYLNYFGADLPSDPVSQHLIGIGLRFHF